MTSHRHIHSSALIILACFVALSGQTADRAAPEKQKPLPTFSAQEIFKRVYPSIMVVESLDAEGKVTKFGSGVVIASGSIITNRHVIEGGVSFRVEHNGKKWPAKLTKVDPDHDLAELSVAGLDAPAVTVLDSAKLSVGETVYAIGSPEGLELTISEGLISGLRDFDKGRVIQTSAAISPGSSGGGLFDAQGRLVGITTFYLKEGQSLNFALPAEWTVALNRQPALNGAASGLNHRSLVFRALLSFEVAYNDYNAGRYEDALAAIKGTLTILPDAWELWAFAGAVYGKLGQHSRAVGAELKAVKLKPGEAAAWYSLGLAYDNLGQNDEALNAYRQAIRIKPDYEEAWHNLGGIYNEFGQYDKEVSAEQEAIRLKPKDEGAWVDLGIGYFGLGLYDKAVSAEEEAIRLNPRDATVWYALGLCFKHAGRQSEVIKVYEKLKTLDPKLADKFFREEVLP